MNHESLISLMDGVSDELIAEAAAPQRKTLTLRRGIAFAAAVAAVLALVLGIPFWSADEGIVTAPGILTVSAITDPSKPEGIPLVQVDSEFYVAPVRILASPLLDWTKGIPITWSYPEKTDSIRLQFSVSAGYLYDWGAPNPLKPKNIIKPCYPYDRIDWAAYIEDEYWEKKENRVWDYIHILLWQDDHIVGYAVVRVEYEYEKEMDGYWQLTLLNSVHYPKVNGKYQTISEKYVRQQIQADIDNK